METAKAILIDPDCPVEGADTFTVGQNNNNPFTWSGPIGVFGFTGQQRVAPLEPCALTKFVSAVPLNLPFMGFGSTQIGVYGKGDSLSHAYPLTHSENLYLGHLPFLFESVG
jgi:hypothetical protein